MLHSWVSHPGSRPCSQLHADTQRMPMHATCYVLSSPCMALRPMPPAPSPGQGSAALPPHPLLRLGPLPCGVARSAGPVHRRTTALHAHTLAGKSTCARGTMHMSWDSACHASHGTELCVECSLALVQPGLHESAWAWVRFSCLSTSASTICTALRASFYRRLLALFIAALTNHFVARGGRPSAHAGGREQHMQQAATGAEKGYAEQCSASPSAVRLREGSAGPSSELLCGCVGTHGSICWKKAKPTTLSDLQRRRQKFVPWSKSSEGGQHKRSALEPSRRAWLCARAML